MKRIRRLLELVKKKQLSLVVTVISGLCVGLLVILQARGFSLIVDGAFLAGRSALDLRPLFIFLIPIILLRALFTWVGEVNAGALAGWVKSNLRKSLVEKITRLGPASVRAERTGELIAAGMEGVEALDPFFSQYIPQLVLSALVPISILVAVFPRDPLSAALMLVTAPLIPLFMYLIGKTAELLTKRQWETLSRLSAHFYDSLQGLTTLKQFGRSRQQVQSIADTSDRYRDATLKVLRVTFLSALVLELVATISTALVAVEVGLRLLYGRMVFQDAFFLLLLAPEFYIPLRMLGTRFHAGMAGMSASRRIYEILDLPEAQKPAQRGVVPEAPVVLSLEALGYTAPEHGDAILQDINLEISHGQTIAFVGPSGAGKTTLVSLLLRFLEPTCGQIKWDGRSQKDIPAAVWRNAIAWVPQSPYLFNYTLAANLRLANPEASRADMDEALRAVNLEAFVHSLPRGYETNIGEGGLRLSAGQAQRLSLARAFLKNAPILILDEPTSNLDPEQEFQIASATRRLMQGRTVITMAHRLNTVFQADCIYFLEGGRVVESGTHAALLTRGGPYARFVGMAAKGSGSSIPIPGESQEIKQTGVDESLPEEQGNYAEVIPDAKHPNTVLRLLGFLKGSWGWVALSVLLGVLTIGSNIGMLGTSAFLIAMAALHPPIAALQLAIVGVRFFGLSRGVFRYTERLVSHNVTFRLLSRLRIWFFQALEPLAPARLMEFRAGDLLNRIVADVDTLENFYVRVVSPPVVAIVIGIGMFAALAQYSLVLGGVYLLLLAFVGVALPTLAMVTGEKANSQVISLRARLRASLVDLIAGLPDILAYGREQDHQAKIHLTGKMYVHEQQKLVRSSGFLNALSVLVINGGTELVLLLGVQLLGENGIPGVMLPVLTLVALAGFEAVLPLPSSANSLNACRRSAQRLFRLVDAKPLVTEPLGAPAISIKAQKPSFSLDHLTMYYPGTQSAALNNISFQLSSGKKIAVVGPSGAGKSTLVNLIQRFWDYSQGNILLDGKELRSLPQSEVRRVLSVISQRSYFFNGSIRENLLIARPSASMEEIQRAADQARIHELICGLPEGYDTPIGERGLRLSGGERQRLAIARAILKDAPIFLLDEMTANLDPVTEFSVLENILSLSASHSLLMITHRLIGLENMDEILVLDKGACIERGTQAVLLAHEGMYWRLWNLQNRYNALL
jgi:ATP-binding cassette, subfamily C, bacterial CydCD